MDSSESAVYRGHWYDSGLLLATFAIMLLLYNSTLVSFYNIYSDEGSGQTHAPLLLAVSIYLLYRAWDRGGRRIELKFNRLALIPLGLFSLLWMVMGLVFIEAGQQASLILIAAMTIIAMLGFSDGAKYTVPLLLLLTLLPFFTPFIPYLQTFSAQASALVLDSIGITLTRDGYLLIIPNGTFEVAESCSGMKFLVVGVTLALVQTQLTRVSARVVLVYAALAAGLAIVSNILRITIVVIIGYQYGMDHEYVSDHNFIGWILFSIFFFLFLFIGERKLRRHQLEERSQAAGVRSDLSNMQRFTHFGIVVLVLSLGPALFGYFINHDGDSGSSPISGLQQIPGWQVASNQLTDWSPIWTRGQSSFEGKLVSGDNAVDLFATEFNRQRQGHEAVNYYHRVYDIDKWSRISRSARVVEVRGAGSLTIEETLLKSPQRRQRLVWMWYSANGKIVSSGIEAKLNNLIGVMSGDPDISVFVLSMEISRDQAHATQVLEQFLEAYLTHSGDLS